MVLFCLNIKKKTKKKTDNDAYGYVLKDVKDFIQKIESMSRKKKQIKFVRRFF